MALQDVQEQIFEGRMLSIGFGTRLQTQLGKKGDELKIASILVGIVPDESLMIRVPSVPGILNKLIEGEPITVRYIYGGNVYGFSSTIMSYVGKPALIVFVTYPASVEILSLRKAQRLECLLPAAIRMAGKEFRGVILDISVGGCRVSTEYEERDYIFIDVEKNVQLSFQLTGTAEDQIINGRVQNVRKDNKLAEMGIQFDAENVEVIDKIKEYIDKFSNLPFLPLIKSDTTLKLS